MARAARPIPHAAKIPEDLREIAFAPVTHLSHWIAARRITSRRLTEIDLARIEALGPKLECFATVTPDRALAEADAADKLLSAGVNLGPLHGIPYGLKNLFDTRRIETGWGAEPFQGRVPERRRRDAAAARRRRRSPRQDDARRARLQRHLLWRLDANPWNLDEGSSGSSAGSPANLSAVDAGHEDGPRGVEHSGSGGSRNLPRMW